MSRGDRSRPLLFAAVLAAASCLAAVACSASVSVGSDDTTTTSSSETTTTLSSSELLEIEEAAQGALLTVAEVGPGFQEMTFVSTRSEDPTACGTPRADNVVEPQVHVGMEAKRGEDLIFGEEIRFFDSQENAVESFNVLSEGLACSQGEVTTDGVTTQVSIGAAVDLTNDLPTVDRATAWEVSDGAIQAQLIAVLMGQLVVTMQFGKHVGAEITNAPDIQAVVTAAVDKIYNS